MRAAAPIAQTEFATLMAPLGPFEPAPLLAAAVSGGADSMALALLADAWASARGGSLLALVVDHGLRPESASEAAGTVQRLAARGIPATMLRLTDLRHGPALAERARAARYAALRAACAGHGILHLLLGHHAADQAETVLMRRQSHSGPAGLAAMPALGEQTGLRLLRPLLGIPPVRLRATLLAAGVAWVEDPSNRDQRALRSRLRAVLNDPDGTGPATTSLCEAACVAGVTRAAQDAEIAGILAERAAIHPEGFAVLSPGPIEPAALAALIQTIGGAGFPPPPAAVAALAAAPRPATLAGVRLLPGGKFGNGLLLAREPRAMGPPVAVRPGAVWDGRFRVPARLDDARFGVEVPPNDARFGVQGRVDDARFRVQERLDGARFHVQARLSPEDDATLPDGATPPDDVTIGALGPDAAGLRRWTRLPSAVLRTLPALRCGNSLVAVPHLLYPDRATCAAMPVVFSPPRPAAGAPFLPSRQAGGNIG